MTDYIKREDVLRILDDLMPAEAHAAQIIGGTINAAKRAIAALPVVEQEPVALCEGWKHMSVEDRDGYDAATYCDAYEGHEAREACPRGHCATAPQPTTSAEQKVCACGEHETCPTPDNPNCARLRAPQQQGEPSVARIKELEDALRGLDPYLDQLVCFASTPQEYKPNRAIANARRALATNSRAERVSIEQAQYDEQRFQDDAAIAKEPKP